MATNNTLPAAMGGMQLPAHLQAMQTTPNVLEGFGAGGGVPRLQMKAGMYSFLDAQGAAIPGFPTKQHAVQVIIVGLFPEANKVYRVWYAGKYQEGEKERPACWSDDNVKPNAKAGTPQATDCNSCAKNVTGSSATGRGKACQSRKHVAVIWADDPSGQVFLLDLPATALFSDSADANYYSLVQLARVCNQSNINISAVVIELKFADGANTGTRFKPLGYISEHQVPLVQQAFTSDDTKELLKVDFPAPEAPGETAPTTAYTAPTWTKAMLVARGDFPENAKEWANHPAVSDTDVINWFSTNVTPL